MTNTAATAPRSEIVERAADREGNGSTRRWTRTLRGVPHSFTAVLMPDGERRYAVSRYNGYGDDGTPEGRRNGMRFGCAWTRIAFWTVKPPAPVAQVDAPAPRQTDRGQLAAVAARNGWTPVEYVVGDTVALMVDRFQRGDVTVTLSYTRTERLRGGDRVVPGQQPQMTGTRNKRATVLAWLTEDDGPKAPDQAAQSHWRRECPDPYNCPTGEHSAGLEDLVNARKRAAATKQAGVTGVLRQNEQGCYDDGMTNTSAPRQTAREQIDTVAAENGWSMYATTDRHHGFRRGDVWVAVSFMGRGAVREAEHRGIGQEGRRHAPARGKRETVIGWLTEGTNEESAEDERISTAVDERDEHLARTGVAGAVAELDAAEQDAERRGTVERSRQLTEAGKPTAADVLAANPTVIVHGTKAGDGVQAVELRSSYRLVGWLDATQRLLTALPDADPVIVPPRLVGEYLDLVAADPRDLSASQRADIALRLLDDAPPAGPGPVAVAIAAARMTSMFGGADKATLRGDQAIVLADRITELEKERDDERVRGDQLAEQLTQVRGQIVELEGDRDAHHARARTYRELSARWQGFYEDRIAELDSERDTGDAYRALMIRREAELRSVLGLATDKDWPTIAAAVVQARRGELDADAVNERLNLANSTIKGLEKIIELDMAAILAVTDQRDRAHRVVEQVWHLMPKSASTTTLAQVLRILRDYRDIAWPEQAEQRDERENGELPPLVRRVRDLGMDIAQVGQLFELTTEGRLTGGEQRQYGWIRPGVFGDHALWTSGGSSAVKVPDHLVDEYLDLVATWPGQPTLHERAKLATDLIERSS